MNITERGFWREVFVAMVASGFSVEDAADQADKAIDIYRKRITWRAERD
jgi:hypothetical protein